MLYKLIDDNIYLTTKTKSVSIEFCLIWSFQVTIEAGYHRYVSPCWSWHRGVLFPITQIKHKWQSTLRGIRTVTRLSHLKLKRKIHIRCNPRIVALFINPSFFTLSLSHSLPPKIHYFTVKSFILVNNSNSIGLFTNLHSPHC